MADLNEVGQPKYATRSALPAVHWDSFFYAVEEAFKLNIQSAGPPGQRAPVFVTDFPKTNEGNFDTSFDVIVFHILGSEMAATSPDNKRRVPKGPTTREAKPFPGKAGYTLLTLGWWEMMSVQFTIYSLSHARADQLVAWFHTMMMRYTFNLNFFKQRGVNYLHFAGRGADEFTREYGQEIYKRTLKYDVRLELLQHFSIKNLEAIELEIPEAPVFSVQEQYVVPKP